MFENVRKSSASYSENKLKAKYQFKKKNQKYYEISNIYDCVEKKSMMCEQLVCV